MRQLLCQSERSRGPFDSAQGDTLPLPTDHCQLPNVLFAGEQKCSRKLFC
jgi:hypothetical protein